MSTTMTTTDRHSTDGNQELAAQNGHGEHMHQATFSPRFDIWEGEDELVLYGDLPGVDADSLDIQFENRTLTIHGKVKRRQDGADYLYSEYDLGDFHRTFAIGEAINDGGIHAELEDGVLTLHLPKADDAKPRRIQIKAK